MDMKKPGLIPERANISNEVKDYGALPIKAPMDGKPNGEILFHICKEKHLYPMTIVHDDEFITSGLRETSKVSVGQYMYSKA